LPFNVDKHHRRSIRLKDYDYSREGAYFVTICTYLREWLFGEIVDGVMKPNEYGRLVEQEWLQTAVLRPNVELDAFVVMPNHVHGIIVITGDKPKIGNKVDNVGTRRAVSLPPRRFGSSIPNSLSSIVGSFKSAVTKQINLARNTPGGVVWQSRFYEEIIRSQSMLDNIRQYIELNPANWHNDLENV
jgi:putative transposase